MITSFQISFFNHIKTPYFNSHSYKMLFLFIQLLLLLLHFQEWISSTLETLTLLMIIFTTCHHLPLRSHSLITSFSMISLIIIMDTLHHHKALNHRKKPLSLMPLMDSPLVQPLRTTTTTCKCLLSLFLFHIFYYIQRVACVCIVQ